MLKTIDAIFDGQVFRPQDPLTLEPNTLVRITIETVNPKAGQVGSFLDIARSLKLDGPPDWATNLETYLYAVEDPDGR